MAKKRISVDIIADVAASFLNALWNTYAFFVLYARLDDVDLTGTFQYHNARASTAGSWRRCIARPGALSHSMRLTHEAPGMLSRSLSTS